MIAFVKCRLMCSNWYYDFAINKLCLADWCVDISTVSVVSIFYGLM